MREMKATYNKNVKPSKLLVYKLVSCKTFLVYCISNTMVSVQHKNFTDMILRLPLVTCKQQQLPY